MNWWEQNVLQNGSACMLSLDKNERGGRVQNNIHNPHRSLGILGHVIRPRCCTPTFIGAIACTRDHCCGNVSFSSSMTYWFTVKYWNIMWRTFVKCCNYSEGTIGKPNNPNVLLGIGRLCTWGMLSVNMVLPPIQQR